MALGHERNMAEFAIYHIFINTSTYRRVSSHLWLIILFYICKSLFVQGESIFNATGSGHTQFEVLHEANPTTDVHHQDLKRSTRLNAASTAALKAPGFPGFFRPKIMKPSNAQETQETHIF